MVVYVLKTTQDLKQNAFDTTAVKWFVIPRLHELVQITIHVLHGNV